MKPPKKYKFTDLIEKRLYFINLLVMNLAWSTGSFTYYMIGFYLKYVPGDLYTNVIVSSLSELISSFVSGIVANYIGTKKTMFFSFMMGAFFGTTLIFINVSDTSLILICVLLTKFGVSSAFNLCFIITAEYFPPQYASTVFGACNIIARLTSILAPLIAEVPSPVPMLVFSLFCVFSTCCTLLLKKESEETMAKKD